MGFSLKVFFDDLQHLIAKDLTPEKKVEALDKLVTEMRAYAKECGCITDSIISG